MTTPMRNPKHAGGFTMIELLVVIAIIMILAGMLFAAFRKVREGAKKAAASSDINTIQAALTAYFDNYGAYPPDAGLLPAPIGSGNPSSENDFRAANKILVAFLRGDISSPPDGAVDAGFIYAPYAKFKKEQLIQEAIGDYYIYVDPWGRVYAYDNNRADGVNFNGQDPNIDLWSAGPDEKWGYKNMPLGPDDDLKKETADNVNNW